ncbi:MAG: hypothetical protein R3A11_03865 [Bdellovibrionota bacterium]
MDYNRSSMFGLGTMEVVGIAIIILIIYGPDRLPVMIKKAAKLLSDLRDATTDVRNTVQREIQRIEQEVNIEMDPQTHAADDPEKTDIHIEDEESHIEYDDDATVSEYERTQAETSIDTSDELFSTKEKK